MPQDSQDSEDDDLSSQQKKCDLDRPSVAFLVLATRFCKASTPDVDPNLFLRASGELLVLNFVVSGLITFFVNPGFLKNNGVRDALGYNNPCVLWDEYPAIVPSAVIYFFSFYYTARFCALDLQRSLVLFGPKRFWVRRLSTVANVSYFASSLVLALIYVVPPARGDVRAIKWHSFFFLQFVLSRYLITAANFLTQHNNPNLITPLQRNFILMFGLLSVMEFGLGMYQVMGFPHVTTPSIGPFLQFVDWTWFGFLFLGSAFSPKGYSIRTAHQLKDERHITMGGADAEDGKRPLPKLEEVAFDLVLHQLVASVYAHLGRRDATIVDLVDFLVADARQALRGEALPHSFYGALLRIQELQDVEAGPTRCDFLRLTRVPPTVFSKCAVVQKPCGAPTPGSACCKKHQAMVALFDHWESVKEAPVCQLICTSRVEDLPFEEGLCLMGYLHKYKNSRKNHRTTIE